MDQSSSSPVPSRIDVIGRNGALGVYTSLREYQELCPLFAKPNATGPAYLMPGLAAEAGEVCDKYAKYIRDGGDRAELSTQLAKELGDVMWFVCMIANYYQINMEDVLHGNVAKLASRLERGVIGGSGDNR